MSGPVDPLDERRHERSALSPVPAARRTAGEAPEEAWWFDFATADGSVGGYARLALRPDEGTAWWWAAAVERGRPLVAFRAHDVAIPTRGTEVRGDGVWACVICETPLEHWSVGVECFGVALDDPLEAWGAERGDVVPFGLDLEWEAAAPAVPAPTDGYYAQRCSVHGEVLIGDDRIHIDAIGHREHSWGPSQLRPGWRLALGPLWGRDSWVHGADGVHDATLEIEAGRDGLPTMMSLTAPPASWEITAHRHSPVAVPGLAVVHSLCATGAAEPGWGWVTSVGGASR